MIKYKMREETKRIILHDSHREPPYDIPWLDEARREALRMGLLSTGYHFIIERDGRVFEIRPRLLIGTHTPSHNLDSLGVCLDGGREAGQVADNFTDEQFDSLKSLCIELRAQFRGPFGEKGELEVVGHDETIRHKRNGPQCPAFDVESFRNLLAV